MLAFHCCDKTHDQKQPGEEKVYFILQLNSSSSGTQYRNPEAETDAETMEELYLLACSVCFLILQRITSP